MSSLLLIKLKNLKYMLSINPSILGFLKVFKVIYLHILNTRDKIYCLSYIKPSLHETVWL